MATHGVPRSASAVNKTEESRQRELQKIQEYKNLVARVYKKRENEEYSEEALAAVSKLLMKNPEYYTIWNNRRQILQFLLSSGNSPSEVAGASEGKNRVQNLLQDELGFLFPLLKQFPKCYWIWNHRLWTLDQATQRLPLPDARKLWQQELTLVGKMLSLDSRNFHGWGYRREIVAALESLGPETAEEAAQGRLMTEAELDYTTKMIGTNLSNFSAWHNRNQLILKLLNERSASDEDRKKMLDDERKLIHRALIDPYDQSLWFYHQNLMCTFDPARASETMAPNLDDSQRIEYLREEIEAVREILDEEEDCKWIYQALIECTMLVTKLEGSTSRETKQEVGHWISELKRLDPVRIGRWADLEKLVNG